LDKLKFNSKVKKLFNYCPNPWLMSTFDPKRKVSEALDIIQWLVHLDNGV